MSNAQSWAETFAPIEQKNFNTVQQATWGHLAPEKNITYRSKIIFCVSAHHSGTRTIIDDGMPNSPWMFDAIDGFINSFKGLTTGVYEVNATFRNFRFWGTPLKIVQEIN